MFSFLMIFLMWMLLFCIFVYVLILKLFLNVNVFFDICVNSFSFFIISGEVSKGCFIVC